MNTLFQGIKFRSSLARVRTTDGVYLDVLPNDLLGRFLYLTGEYERSVIDLLYRLAQPGDVLLDIGANIGYISACFLHAVPGSKVIAIEPQPRILDLLRRNVAKFGDRVEILPVAISDTAGQASFAIDNNNLGNSRIVSSDTGLTVDVATGDDLLRSADRIDLVKIDIQGHEARALRSMCQTIERLKPKAIIFEDENGDLTEISGLLRGFGYEMKAIQKTMRGFRISEIGKCSCDNYLAIRAESLRELY